MKILVSGGAGFVGSHFVEALLHKGHGVSILDDFSTGRLENVPLGVPVHEGDLRHTPLPALLEEERPEVVVHLAAQMNVRKSVSGPEADADVNILGTLRLFHAAAQAGVRRIVFASSGGTVYGEHPGRPSMETDLPRPASPYGIAKLTGEHYGRYFAREFVALRLANVYGPRQNPRGEAGVVALFLEAMAGRRSPLILGDGEQTRDFLWIGDAVSAFLLALEGPVGTYNVGTGVETSVNAIYEHLSKIMGFQGESRRVPGPPGELRRNALCSDLARRKLGWTPTMDLAAGLQATADVHSQSPGLGPVD